MPLWTSANRGCLAKKYWCLFRRFGMCYTVFYKSYKIFLRHLTRWMYRVLNLLNVPCVQRQCWCGAFYVSLSYHVAVIVKIRKGIRKYFASFLVDSSNKTAMVSPGTKPRGPKSGVAPQNGPRSVALFWVWTYVFGRLRVSSPFLKLGFW